MEAKESVLFGIDIETSGCLFSTHHIIAIGYYACRLDGHPLMKKRVAFAGPHNFEQRCTETFWKPNQSLYETLMAGAVDVIVGMQTFLRDLDQLDSMYTVAIVSDNPSFDVAWINNYIDRLFQRRPLNYIHGGTGYRSVYDTDSFSRGVTRCTYNTPKDFDTVDAKTRKSLGIELPADVVHNHLPENDAHYIVEMHRQTVARM